MVGDPFEEMLREVRLPDEVADVERQVPGTTIDIVAVAGNRLTDLAGQDSCSFELAHLYERAMEEQYRKAVDLLHFEFEESGD